MTSPPATKATDRERDRLERQALEFFIELYGDQGDRTLALITEANENELESMIAALYQNEPERGAAAYFSFWRPIVTAIGLSALAGFSADTVGAALGDDDDTLSAPLDDALERYLREMARLFGERYSRTSLQMTFAAIQDWRDRTGATVGELRETLSTFWEGDRPAFAATTETTAIVADTRVESYRAAGFWGYDVHTRGINTRPEHQEIADNGPYPVSDRLHVPPYRQLFADPGLTINCYCWTTPVVEDPNAG